MIRLLSLTQQMTDPLWIDQLGQVDSWQHQKTFPGGPSSAQFNFIAPPDLKHRALLGGRLVVAYSGSSLCWSGRLNPPTRGTPWSFTCTGAAALAKDYSAHNPSNVNASAINGTIDAAIADGLPWERSVTLTNVLGVTNAYSTTVDGLLGDLVSQGAYWNLDDARNLTTPPVPAAATHLLAATTLPPRTLDGYLTAVSYTYVDSSAASHSAVSYAASSLLALYGTIFDNIDLTSRGPLTAAQAASVAAGLLAKYATTGPAWTSGFAVLPGQLFTIGGALVTDFATLDALMSVRVVGLTAADGLTGAVDVPVGQVDYDDTTGQAVLTPLAISQDSFLAALARSASS